MTGDLTARFDSMVSDLTGSVIGGYTLGARLGAGGMGQVYRARRPGEGVERAIKVMPLSMPGLEKLRARFDRESEIHRSLSHPNLVSLLDRGEEQGIRYLVMELVEGGDLASLLDGESPMALDQILSLASGMIEGIAHLHGRGIVHRDLKPANVLIAEHGVPKITDFGLARAEDATALTRAHAVLGTVPYLAPEFLRGEAASQASDLYAFGLILYEMITAKFPYQAEEPRGWMSQISNVIPAPVDGITPGTPKPLALLVAGLLEKDPHRRAAIAEARRTLAGLAQPSVRRERRGSPAATTVPIAPRPGTPRRLLPAALLVPGLVIVVAVLARIQRSDALPGSGATPTRILDVERPGESSSTIGHPAPREDFGPPAAPSRSAGDRGWPSDGPADTGEDTGAGVAVDVPARTARQIRRGRLMREARAELGEYAREIPASRATGGSGSPAVDLAELVARAESGDAGAQYLLGRRYEEGDGVEQGHEQAIFWYRRASRGGNRAARERLADLGVDP